MATDNPLKPTCRDEFEIAIVCTRALEYDALCLLFDDFWDTDGDPFGRAQGDLNTYTTGCMGNFNVVVVLLCSPGKASAASATASLRSSYNCIELLLLAGICEGVPDVNGQELLLGDIVISETVIEYDIGTQFTAAFREKNTLEEMHGRANKNIRNFTANIKTERGYELLEDKVALFLRQIQNRVSQAKYRQRRKAASYMYPGSTNDILFESSHRHRHYNSSQCVCADYSPDEDFYAVCDQSRDLDCEQTGCEHKSAKTRTRLHLKNKLANDGDAMSAQIPHIFLGRFGSGDTAFGSGIHRDSLAQKHNIIAFETEGAGVWDELPCIIVKGVSNYGDGHKSQKLADWQFFAAAAAASVTRALIERYPRTDKSPATELKLQERKACLDALFITNTEDDKTRIEETKGGLLLDAYIWIMQNEEFMEWLEDPITQLLWVKGDPGKGKTMLLCGIINELEKDPKRDIYYFLCQATDVRLNNSSAVLRGLLHMIVVRQPSLISFIRNEYDKAGKSAFEGANSWIVLSRIFEQMLRGNSLEEPIFIIDALDECVTGSAELLELIVRSLSSSSRLKWLVSSRNQADIHEALTAAKIKSTVSLELNAESVSAAVTTYIRYKVRILSDKKGYEQPRRNDIETYLSKNANGTFLWVALVCVLLAKAPQSDHLPKSADLPPGLDKLYMRMIDGVCALPTSHLGRRVLAIATVTQRPLTTQEFAALIKTDDGGEDQGGTRSQHLEYDWNDILGHCGSFLTMRNGTIYFIHQSAKDFLVKQASHQLFPTGAEYVHREILASSLSAMRNTLRKDIYGLGDPAFSIDNLSQRALIDDPLSSIKYSCVYWIHHFRQSISKDKKNVHESHELIYTFLTEKYVYWLEALGLLKSMFDMLAGMQMLEQLVVSFTWHIQPEYFSLLIQQVDTEILGLHELAWDAHRFIQMFGTAIADFPLQVYLSAMIFSPARSITRQLFRKEALEWVQTLPADEVEWASSSRTYESDGPSDINVLTASCCGTWIAALRAKMTIPIWQTNSGKIIRVLDACHLPGRQSDYQGLRTFEYGCFSPWTANELSSSLYGDHYVIIWDVTTGEVLRQLSIGESVSEISYLTSARDQLGCLSRNSNLKTMVSIWNTKTGQMLKQTRLQDSSGWYILSPANEFKLDREGWKFAKIYNMDTYSAIDIHESSVKKTKLSPDGSLLAIATNRRLFVLSDTTSGKVKQTIKLTTDIEDFALSPDGKLLAMATFEGIKIFNLTSGKYLRKFMTKSTCLTFSSDGSKIFSALGAVIHVAEIAQESLITPGPSDSSRDKSVLLSTKVSISPDCKLIASVLFALEFGQLQLILKVTDINSRIFTHVLKHLHFDETDRNPRVLFSPDSRNLALVLGTMIIFWNISLGSGRVISTQKWTSYFYDAEEEDMAFSADSARFALMLCKADAYSKHNLTIQVWDSDSGKRLMHIGQRRNSYTKGGACISFSPDSQRLAISWLDENCNNKTIRVEIWEIASNSAVQVIDLDYYYSNNHVRISSPSPVFARPPGEEYQRDEKVDTASIEAKFRGPVAGVIEWSFFGEGLLMLDLRFEAEDSYIRQDAVPANTYLRITLRTRTDLDLTGQASSMARFREAKVYDIDTEQTWIEFCGTRLVWVPPQYRYVAQDSLGNCVAFTREDESLCIIQFQRDKLATKTYLPELPNNCGFVYRDMNPPDNKLLEKIGKIDRVKEPLSVVSQKAMRDLRRGINLQLYKLWNKYSS